MNHRVFNNSIGDPTDFGFSNLSQDATRHVLASIFEQLLIFDKITISTNRVNYPLYFLIKELGINKVEELVEKEIIEFLIWSPVIVTGSGREREDGTLDESVIYSQPPIAAGTLSDEDSDPENHIEKALSRFNIHRDRKRIFKRKVTKSIIVPDGMEFSTSSAEIVIDAYKQNNLVELGLPYDAEPEKMTPINRKLLLNLGHKVLETAVLSKYGLKSFENYAHYKICQQNLKNIGDALKVSTNTSQLLTIENIPNLKDLYLQESLDFDNVLSLRYKSNAKYFRKWINEVSESCNAQEITKEYINEIKGNGKFFQATGGKLVRNIGVWGIGTGLGAILAGPIGAATGFGLGLLDTFLLESILKGKNPSMFIESIRRERENNQAGEV